MGIAKGHSGGLWSPRSRVQISFLIINEEPPPFMRARYVKRHSLYYLGAI